MQSMKIYVAGPYTANTLREINANIQRAIDAGIHIWKKGHFPYIPHLLHWVDIRATELNVPMDWEDYILWDAPWLDACDALLLLAESKGALIELKRAKDEGKVIFRSLEEIPAVTRGPVWADAYRE
ncbi:MAG: DUF4406 domain-containing protein [Candidatus Thorarchaeota archaeon]|nr:DUF4406 domain-containing protein [Candidatus Thorarchaeota archaeon]